MRAQQSKRDAYNTLNVTTISGHTDVESCAVLGQLVNLLDCASRILNYAPKHYLQFRGSRSFIVHRISLEMYVLDPICRIVVRSVWKERGRPIWRFARDRMSDL